MIYEAVLLKSISNTKVLVGWYNMAKVQLALPRMLILMYQCLAY